MFFWHNDLSWTELIFCRLSSKVYKLTNEFLCRTVCVTCVWAGVDSVWDQEKLEARKMLENAAESHTSGARFVRRFLLRQTCWLKKDTTTNLIKV